MGRVEKYLCSIVLAATLAASSGCSSLLAPRAPDSMPGYARDIYDKIKSAGKNTRRGYVAEVEVRTPQREYRLEISIGRHEKWNMYIQTPLRENEWESFSESQEGLEIWQGRKNGSYFLREPLPGGQELYRQRLEELREGQIIEPDGDPFITGHILGKRF